jgi:hypothetical protein
MKGRISFNPARCDYGGATASVRRVLAEWVEIDWFEPPGEISAEIRAIRRFEKHHERSRTHAPDLFSSDMQVRVERGSWGDFAKWCARVRANTSWDWKEGVLKRLSFAHSQRFNLKLRDYVRANLEKGEQPDAGELFFQRSANSREQQPCTAAPTLGAMPGVAWLTSPDA